MSTFMYENDKEYTLDQHGVSTVLEELSTIAPQYDFLICNLADGRMTFEVLAALPSRLEEVCGSKIVAVDLSFNRILCNSWEEIEPVLDQLLGKRIVQFLDLSYNDLPALETLQQNSRLSEKVRNFGNRLSLLGRDGNPLTGNADIDYWICNARAFKQAAYGCRYIDD